MKSEKITLEVVFRNIFQPVEVPAYIKLEYDKGHDCSIYTMDKPRVLRGRQIIVSGEKVDLRRAMDFWKQKYGEELYTESYKLREE